MLLVWVIIVLQRAKPSILPNGNFREFFLRRGEFCVFKTGIPGGPGSRSRRRLHSPQRQLSSHWSTFHTVFNMLSTQPLVRVFALDFSKAFDTFIGTQLSWERWPALRYSYLMPSTIRWSTFQRSFTSLHQVRRQRLCRTQASVIQGSAIGPASFIATALWS